MSIDLYYHDNDGDPQVLLNAYEEVDGKTKRKCWHLLENVPNPLAVLVMVRTAQRDGEDVATALSAIEALNHSILGEEVPDIWQMIKLAEIDYDAEAVFYTNDLPEDAAAWLGIPAPQRHGRNSPSEEQPNVSQTSSPRPCRFLDDPCARPNCVKYARCVCWGALLEEQYANAGAGGEEK